MTALDLVDSNLKICFDELFDKVEITFIYNTEKLMWRKYTLIKNRHGYSCAIVPN